ncbi:hypothetical protein RRG08_000088 [Elysia crispata]|uniref:Uncharacterized protein n=1 Tax=Elysia crispata TaxID=231223 RepID=A0AAE1A1K8_9GAST|nr:hypothetical protein RRG08_000088 [Elysia crispata]
MFVSSRRAPLNSLSSQRVIAIPQLDVSAGLCRDVLCEGNITLCVNLIPCADILCKENITLRIPSRAVVSDSVATSRQKAAKCARRKQPKSIPCLNLTKKGMFCNFAPNGSDKEMHSGMFCNLAPNGSDKEMHSGMFCNLAPNGSDKEMHSGMFCNLAPNGSDKEMHSGMFCNFASNGSDKEMHSGMFCNLAPNGSDKDMHSGMFCNFVPKGSDTDGGHRAVALLFAYSSELGQI